jgi:hypothetical protein
MNLTKSAIKASKGFLLKIPVTREILFFLFGKKIYKRSIDKKILNLLSGVSRLSKKKVEGLIVSFTSFPGRIDEIKYTLFSLFNQTLLPERFVLWLAESQFPGKENDLPQELLAFERFGLEIRWCDDLRSYKKLVPALEQFPGHCIVTADDDLYYNKNWLKKLMQEHTKHPGEVVCHIAHRIRFDKHNNLLPYAEWKFNTRKKASFLNFTLSGGGVLWHKSYFYKDIARSDLFTELAPNADDIWFYCMAIKGNTRIRVVKKPCNRVKYVNPYREYNLFPGYKLATINVDNGQNDIQFKKVMNYYKIDYNALP